MLTKFGKCSIIDVWGGPDSALECNSMKSDTKIAAEVILKMEIFIA